MTIVYKHEYLTTGERIMYPVKIPSDHHRRHLFVPNFDPDSNGTCMECGLNYELHKHYYEKNEHQ